MEACHFDERGALSFIFIVREQPTATPQAFKERQERHTFLLKWTLVRMRSIYHFLARALP
jgi:hypothetical protein